MRAILQLCAVATVLLVSSACGDAADSDTFADDQKAILVTGASTGIGRNIAERLASEGHYVYAGARKQVDIDALNAIENVQAIRLDVTIQEEIDAAVETIKKEGRGLYGLINNAGVGIAGPMIEVPEDDFRWLMDVNVFGVFRVTQAFAPLIIENKGRIATIGSIAGTLSGKFMGPYSMSKHAIEAFTDSLAAEMGQLGVQVSVIEPGNYNSKISETGMRRMAEKGYANENSYYREELKAMLDRGGDRSQYKEPDEVAEAAVHALFAEKPLRRYMVVPEEKEARWTVGQQIRELVQLNEWQAYSYTRDELIAMLDATMAPTAE